MTMSKDPNRYFRMEARDLLEGLNQSVLEIERGDGGSEAIARILRLAHTLKGASRVVRQAAISEMAHTIEDVFAPFRESGGRISREQTTKVLRLLDAIAGEVAALGSESTGPLAETARPSPSEDFLATVRVEIEEVDRLLIGVAEASSQLIALQRECEGIKRASLLARAAFAWLVTLGGEGPRPERRNGDHSKILALVEELRGQLEHVERRLPSAVDHVAADFAQIRDAGSRLRLIPATTVFADLQRAVRDAAQTLHKEVTFETFGGDIRLDSHVLLALRDALLHVVRNAVAHGIESNNERRAAGKPTKGRVGLRVERRGSRIAFLCHDEGRGIDVEAIRTAAVHRGLVSSSQAASLGLEDVVQIILKGGVTTTNSVNEVSGRGIGLDVVRETAAQLKGEVAIRSEPGRGTSLEICVPISVSSFCALEVDAGGVVASIPLDAVRQTLRVTDNQIVRSGDKDSVVCNDLAIPFLDLKNALVPETTADHKPKSRSVIVVEASGEVVGIGVNRLLGTKVVVLRPLPAWSATDEIIAGTSLDIEGNPQPVLDPDGVVRAACAARARAREAKSAPRAPVLIIDDSLTTRMLEQSILESAGYLVDLAVSAEEALSKARQKRYGIFLVDVEMPGMDGFDFVSRTQRDPALRAVPSILVTSRTAEEDRRRALEVGARAYITKSEFDQGYLLEKLREFVG